jgi:ribonuclease R
MARRRGQSRPGRSGGQRSGGKRSEGNLESRVLSALAGSEQGPLKTKELARALDVPADEYRSFRRLLTGLERAGKIYRLKGHRYAVAAKLDLATGSLSLTRNGDGFIRPDEGSDDVFVPSQRLGTAMHGDRVVARIERRPRGRSREGTVIRVLERARETVVGTFHRGPKFSYVTPLDVRMNRDVLIVPGDEEGAEDGEVVVARLISYGEGRLSPTGAVDRVLGDLSEPGVDVLAVAYGFGISLDFPPEVISAAEEAARDGLESPGPDRTDRTDLLCFTIDPADAKDHDDALSVVELDDGVVEVGVHIADVSHFVRPGTAVDVEAMARATSVYLVDRTIPMLPPVLSNRVCSLEEGEVRFAVSLFMQLDREGRVLSRKYERTMLRCRNGLSYEEAQKVLDGDGSVSQEVDEAIRTLDDRARRVRDGRFQRGALDFDLPEAKVVLDEAGLPVDIQKRVRTASHRLIEDYMILANEVVAGDMEARGLNTMYRVHEPPARERVELLADSLSRFGLKVPMRKSLKSSDMQGLLKAVSGREEEILVNSLVLRSLKKARYHTENLGHFGLGSDGYLHFTSPIRRYPDLVVHRVVTEVLVHGAEQPYRDAQALALSAERCSGREQAAAEAERASVALKKVEFMERHLGDEFAGRISGVAAFGFFVTLEDFFVEGLVHVSGLHDDFYHYRETDYALVGERGGRRFRLGDRVEVQVARVDKEARHIDFQILRELA